VDPAGGFSHDAAPRRLACIDIGSNTTRLLVADRLQRRLSWVHEERAFTRIGAELRRSAELGEAKIDEIVRVVDAQRDTARRLGADPIRVVATAAIRAAGNGRRVCETVAAATGLRVSVLSDQEEARLAFVGAAGTSPEFTAGLLGVVDVGGGSSEVVAGVAPDEIRWWASLPVGSSTLAAADSKPGHRLAEARERLAAELDQLSFPRPGVALAAGGSATSLGRLVGPVLTPDTLRRALDLLTTAPGSEIAARFGIDRQRVALLPGGLVILEAVAERFGVPLHVGRGGIREGVLLEA
jgi:exopolyphosphatase/guanosine-5'-triphosphate,3'-diphosphate pyrophosphatase